MWTLIEATETTERYTYGRATLELTQFTDGDWGGVARGESEYGLWEYRWADGSKKNVMDELLNYTRLHEEPIPYQIAFWYGGRPVIKHAGSYYLIARNGEQFQFEPIIRSEAGEAL